MNAKFPVSGNFDPLGNPSHSEIAVLDGEVNVLNCDNWREKFAGAEELAEFGPRFYI